MRFSFFVVYLVLFSAQTFAADNTGKPVNLGVVDGSTEKSDPPDSGGGGAQEMLNTKTSPDHSEDDATREGKQRLQMESIRMQNTLPDASAPGRYGTGSIPNPSANH
jgi:hypothetical protein